MTKFLVGAALVVLVAAPAQAAPIRSEHSTMTHGERPQRETVLLKAMPLRAEMRHEIRQAIRERRERRERREAREAARAAAAAAEPTTPPPAPSYSTSSSGGVMSEAEAASYLRAAGFPESVIPTMIGFGHRESGLCPTAVNGLSGCPSYATAAAFVSQYHACGWLQMYPCYGGTAWLDPAVNAHMAFSKYQSAGLSPWDL